MTFARWCLVLRVLTVAAAVQALGWAVLGAFDPFGAYETRLARALWGAERLGDDARRTFAFALGPLGATTLGFWLLAHALVRHAFPRRERWAYRAFVGALAAWFVVDSAASLARGGAFNVWLVNVPCLVLFGVPLLAVRGAFAGSVAANAPRAAGGAGTVSTGDRS